eukprot:TRINITY_DN104359_c0_g1_i1.p1 TRINITY_DN104359_c0_g1~~TRINITY_DN104359_c0_g1_i1.p1  ORF type:complete len:553 (-),score=69.38 TRINITY_DN104359_c0_g1_i1:161-1717(-)
MADVREPRCERREVLVVGAGLSGIVMMKRLREAGLSFLTVDRASGFGGTWHWNRYPGAACDVDGYTYLPFLHELGFCPASKFVSAPEIRQHLEAIASKAAMEEDTLFQTALLSADYDEARGIWCSRTDRGDVIESRFLILCCGPLSTPRLPDVTGMNDFKGESFHTSRWPEGAQVADKVVAVVGTGCSAAQVVPEIAKVARELLVFQRTPCWCVPRGQEATPAALREKILSQREATEVLRSEVSEWFDNELYPTFQDRERNKAQAANLRANLMAAVSDPEVAEKLCPAYDVGCKRNVVSDDYWPAFNRGNVKLVAEGGVKAVSEDSVVTAAGSSFPVDVIVYATGFDAFTGGFRKFEVRGVNQTRLLEHWAHGPRTLLGIHASGFPNMFLMVGPQSPTILTNTTDVILRQSEYILAVVGRTRQTSTGSVDACPSAEDSWVQFCKSHYPDSVWSRCDNWYNKRSQLQPGSGKQGEHGSVDGFIGKYEEYYTRLDSKALLGLRFGTEDHNAGVADAALGA